MMNEANRRILRNECLWHNIPIISNDTEIFLKEYIGINRPNSIIEIWSAVWYSTSILWEAMSCYNPYGEIFSWEISYPHYRQSLTNTQSYKNIRILLWNFCNYNCDNLLKKWYFDMVFIDGRKSETLLYLKNLSPYIHQTTHIIIDDVIKFKEKMQDCYDFLDKHNIYYDIYQIDSDDGVLVIPKWWPLIKALSSL